MKASLLLSALVFSGDSAKSLCAAFGIPHQRHCQATTSRTVTSLGSTYIREPQTFEQTNLGFSEPKIYDSLSRTSSTRTGERESSSNASLRQDYYSPSPNAADEVTVHGGGVLRTWSFEYSNAAEVAHIHVRTEGSPIDAAVELWEGPNYAPIHVRAYSQDGTSHPISIQLLLDDSRSSSLAIRNTGPNTFPLRAAVTTSDIDSNLQSLLNIIGDQSYEDDVQGGASLSYPLDSTVERTQLMLRTDGRPLNARVELMQGPSNNKLVAEVQSMDGIPILLSFETPGYANVLRVINLSPLEFPIVSLVDPSHIDPRGLDDRRRQYMGMRGGGGTNNFNQFSEWDDHSDSFLSSGRRDRWTRNNRNSDLRFKSSSMNRDSDTKQRRILASETNGRFGSAGKMEPWPGKNTFSPQGGYRAGETSNISNRNSTSRFGSVSDRARLSDESRIRGNNYNRRQKYSSVRAPALSSTTSSANWYDTPISSSTGTRDWWNN